MYAQRQNWFRKGTIWIIHGTADRAVSIKESKVVVDELKQTNNDKRLKFDWLKGASHGALARILYMNKTYEWLFSHSILDKDRPVNNDIDIVKSDLSKAYQDMISGSPDPEVVYDKTLLEISLYNRPLKSPFLRDIVLTQYLATFFEACTK